MKKILICLLLITSNTFALGGLQFDACPSYPGTQKKCKDVVQALIFDRSWVLGQNQQLMGDQNFFF